MVPLPAQGHLNQFLRFSRLLAIHGLSVHYVSTATHIRQARDRAVAGTLRRRDGYPLHHLIQFHHPPLPPFSSPPPDPHASTKFPSHLQPAFDAALHLKSAIDALVRSLAATSRRLVIVHDGPMSFAASSAALAPNIESFTYHAISAIDGYFLRREARGEPANAELNLPDLSNYMQVASDEFLEFLRCQRQHSNIDAGRILNTCPALEARFIDLVAHESGWEEKKLFAIGHLNAIAISESETNNSGVRHECLLWLDEQLPESVLYVSFGTTTTLADEQVAEIAAGLEASTQRFIWVLKDADRADIYAPTVDGGVVARKDKLPLDYYRRIDGRGKVVGGWVPQPEILAHPSIGGFMSHCGWNSCLESFINGVPMLAWPMHSDQPRNAQLVTHLMGVGFPVRGAAGGDVNGVVPSTAIREPVRKLMPEEEGKEARARARELGMEVRAAVKDGGSSKADLDAFVTHITR